MKLCKQREDVKFIKEVAFFADGDDIDQLREAAKRYQHLISWAEAVLCAGKPDADYAAMERWEMRVVKDTK